ncbi:MAG: hypothetical protein A2X77_03930 [Gammaproteobacteria bacterium GWE2_42_36]|nr:MAG: hypothetical protein A2X77_03930 [Gammaproteobacteria bacterium GWE2_42_36]HCU04984.1 cell division protein ZapA [Coxiellaceae bacterium]
MTDHHNVAVEILGKTYKVRCPQDRVQELQNAATYVDKEMRKLRDSGKVIGIEHIAIIAALNIAYQLLNVEQKEDKDIDVIANRIRDMQRKIEVALTQKEQLTLSDLEEEY